MLFTLIIIIAAAIMGGMVFWGAAQFIAVLVEWGLEVLKGKKPKKVKPETAIEKQQRIAKENRKRAMDLEYQLWQNF